MVWCFNIGVMWRSKSLILWNLFSKKKKKKLQTTAEVQFPRTSGADNVDTKNCKHCLKFTLSSLLYMEISRAAASSRSQHMLTPGQLFSSSLFCFTATMDRNESYFLVTLGIFLLATILFLCGFGSPNWEEVDTGFYSGNSGLFKACAESTCVTLDLTDNDLKGECLVGL